MSDEIKCPKCGNSDLSKFEYRELVPYYYKRLKLEDGVLTVDPNSKSSFNDCSEGSTLVCQKCCQGVSTDAYDSVTQIEFEDWS